MPQNDFTPLANKVLRGKLQDFIRESAHLENVFGDPITRRCPVYLPPGYDHGASKNYPLLVELAPFTNSGLGRVGWRNFDLSVPERIDKLIRDQKMPPAVVAFPDCFNSLGGSQFVNSPVLGNVHDFLHDDLVPALEKKFQCGGEGYRIVYGKSSGGFGALHSVFERPGFWAGAACHSGDIGFELAFLPDMAIASLTLESFNWSIPDFLKTFWQSERLKGEWIMTIMLLAMAASYDPVDLKSHAFGLRLPVDLRTLEVHHDRFQNWLNFDPLNRVTNCQNALRDLKMLYIDCGRQDQYRLQFGARRMSRALNDQGIAHIYQEFEGTHSGIDHRLETSLPLLLKAIS